MMYKLSTPYYWPKSRETDEIKHPDVHTAVFEADNWNETDTSYIFTKNTLSVFEVTKFVIDKIEEI